MAKAQARERPHLDLFWFEARGQQTRLDSGADGHSPDERERDAPWGRAHALLPCVRVCRGFVRPDSGSPTKRYTMSQINDLPLSATSAIEDGQRRKIGRASCRERV